MEILWCGQNSHFTLEITSTHFKKHHSTRNSTCSNDQTATRPCEGAHFMRQTAPGQHAHGQYRASHQRPPKRPTRHTSIAGGWSIGAARSTRRISSTLEPARRARKYRRQSAQARLTGRGAGGWPRAVLHCARDMLWGQGVNWGQGAPGIVALLACKSSAGPDAKSGLRARGANRGAGSVVGSRGGAGRARFHPHIRKPAPYQPYPYSLNLTGHPREG